MDTHEAKFHCTNRDQSLIVERGCEWVQMLLDKNSDYGSSVFKVPILAPHLSVGTSIRVRMSDKIERLQNLIKQSDVGFKVNESFDDTVRDLGAYCLLYLIAMNSEKDSPQSESPDC